MNRKIELKHVQFEIKDVSHPNLTMYRINVYYKKYNSKLQNEVDKFIRDNYPDHDCLKFGDSYLLRNVDYMDMAIKLRF